MVAGILASPSKVDMRKNLNLQPLLFLRSVREKEAQGEAARKRAELEAEERKLRLLEQALADHLARSPQVGKKELDPQEMIEHQRYLHLLRRRIGEQRKRVEQKMQEYRTARLLLLERAKERKVVEKLQERIVEARRTEQSKQEQSLADEVAVVRYQSPEENEEG